MKTLLLTATALSLIGGSAFAAGNAVPAQFATQLNGAILNGSKTAPANAAAALKNRAITVEGTSVNAGAASGGQAGGKVTVAPRLLVATPATGAASGGVAPTNNNPVVVPGQGGNNAKAIIATPGQGNSSGGVGPGNPGGNVGPGFPGNGTFNPGSGQNSAGNRTQQAQFLITTPGQGNSSGGVGPGNNGGNGGFPGQGTGGQFGGPVGGQALPVVVGPQGNPGGGVPGNGNFGQPGQGQFGGQQSAGNFGGDARFVPAGGFDGGAPAFQPQPAPAFNGGGQARVVPVASGADLYQRMVGQGYWAVAVLSANTSVFQVLAVDNQHSDYAFLVMVEIDYGRIVNVRPIPLARNVQPSYGNPHGTYTAQATPAPNYYKPATTYPAKPSYSGYGQASYNSRY